MPAEERVTPSEILAAAGADNPVTGTFLQRTGLILAMCVGALGTIVIFTLVFGWMHSAPTIPVIPANADVNTAKATIENYKSLQQAALEPFTTLFDSIIAKVLLPVFTSILGYIFGSRSSDRQ